MKILFTTLSFLLLFLPGTASSSNLLVTSVTGDNVLEYDGRDGSFVAEFIPPGLGGLTGPAGITFGSNGNLFVLDINLDKILEFDGGDGSFIGNFGPTVVTGDCIELGPDGNFYACDRSQNQILQVSPEGSSNVFATGISGPQGLDWGPNGDLFVGGFSDNAINRYDGTTGQFISTFVTAGLGGLSGPIGVKFGPDGNLYVSSFNTNQILRYDGVTGAFMDVFVSAGLGGLTGPYGLLFRNDGNLYVASADSEEVLRYNATTGAFVDAFVPAMSGGLTSPLYLTTFPAGILQFSMDVYNVNQNSGTAMVEVTRTNGSNGEVTVQFTTSNGTAVAGIDYIDATQTLIFAEGETSKTISISIIDNNLNEGHKTVNLSLSNVTDDAILGTIATALLNILEEDLSGGGGCQLTKSPGFVSPWQPLAGLILPFFVLLVWRFRRDG